MVALSFFSSCLLGKWKKKPLHDWTRNEDGMPLFEDGIPLFQSIIDKRKRKQGTISMREESYSNILYWD